MNADGSAIKQVKDFGTTFLTTVLIYRCGAGRCKIIETHITIPRVSKSNFC